MQLGSRPHTYCSSKHYQQQSHTGAELEHKWLPWQLPTRTTPQKRRQWRTWMFGLPRTLQQVRTQSTLCGRLAPPHPPPAAVGVKFRRHSLLPCHDHLCWMTSRPGHGAELGLVLGAIGTSIKAIASRVARAGLEGLYGTTGTTGGSGDQQKKLDVVAVSSFY